MGSCRAAEKQEDKNQQQFQAGNGYACLHTQTDKKQAGTQCFGNTCGMQPGIKIRKTMYTNPTGDAEQGA